MRTCEIAGCRGRHQARGMCGTHYMRWRAHRTDEEIASTLNLSARIDDFLATGRAVCSKHGEHDAFTLQIKTTARTGAYRALRCRPCGAEAARRWNAAHPGQSTYYTSVRGKANGLIHGARARAATAGVPCTITWEWIIEQCERQSGRCAYTGWEFDNVVKGRGGRRNLRGMSLDRVDPSGGYTPENVRVVCWGVNQAKSNTPFDEFLAMCKAVAKVAAKH